MKGFLLLLLVVVVLGQPTQLNYKVGQQFGYWANTQLVGSGFDVQNNEYSQGTTSEVQVKVALQVMNKKTSSYNIGMTLFHPTFTVTQPGSDGYSTYSDDQMGDTVFFEQGFDGYVSKVVSGKNDNPTYAAIKLGVINAFNTKFVGVNENTLVQDTDPLGIHNSSIFGNQGSEQVALTLTKAYSQSDFITFSDKKVHPENVLLGVTNVIGIHSSGYILSSAFSQTAQLYAPNVGDSLGRPENGSAADTNMITTSNIVVTESNANDYLQFFKTFMDQSKIQVQKDYENIDFDSQGQSMFELGSFLIEKKQSQVQDLEYLRFSVQKMLTELLSPKIASEKDGERMYHVQRYWRTKSCDQVDRELLPVVHSAISRHKKDARIVGNAMTLVASLHVGQTQKFLVEAGLEHSWDQAKLAAIFASAAVERPSVELMSAIWELSERGHETVSHVATLHIGILLKKIFNHAQDFEAYGAKFRNALIQRLDTELNSQKLTWILYSVKNAGIDVMTDKLECLSKKIHRIFSSQPSSSVTRALVSLSKDLVQSPVNVKNSDYPYNRTYSTEFHTGGKAMGIFFTAGLFAGTNFNCNQTQFNFEVEAIANATSYFMGYTHNLFEILAIYGQDNGSPLADDLVATVWGNVIYSSTFPELDCFHHTYPLSMATPSYSVSYTLWVAVIPVTFSFSVSLSFLTNLDWQICPNTLDAEIDITPYATFTINGGIDVDFYIIKADVTLAGNLNGAVIPEAYIHGTECTVGFEIDRTNQPMYLTLSTSYAYQTCVLFFFDCHWSDPIGHTWLSWNEPSSDVIIYQDSWKIHI